MFPESTCSGDLLLDDFFLLARIALSTLSSSDAPASTTSPSSINSRALVLGDAARFVGVCASDRVAFTVGTDFVVATTGDDVTEDDGPDDELTAGRLKFAAILLLCLCDCMGLLRASDAASEEDVPAAVVPDDEAGGAVDGRRLKGTNGLILRSEGMGR